MNEAVQDMNRRGVWSPRQSGYRPFRSNEEIDAVRDRWVLIRGTSWKLRITAYCSGNVVLDGRRATPYPEAFCSFKFEDGSPFGLPGEMDEWELENCRR